MGLLNKIFGNNNFLLDWQNTLIEPRQNKLKMTRIQMESITIQQLQNDMRIFDDCSNLINTTYSPDVFFERLSLAENKLEHLVLLEPFLKQMKSITMMTLPSELLYILKNNKQEYISGFLHRYYNKIKEKAQGMKTEKGKQNQYQNFYNSLRPYFEQINQSNRKYIEVIRSENI